jgi:hypothetical protein
MENEKAKNKGSFHLSAVFPSTIVTRGTDNERATPGFPTHSVAPALRANKV